MRPKVAFYWCAACGGCEECIVDLGDDLLRVIEAVEIAFWPVALDYKEKDLQAMPDASLDIAFVNGAVRNVEQKDMAELLRAKAKTIVAFGACAQLGGIPGLANLSDSRAILDTAYGENGAPREEYGVDGETLSLPGLLDAVLPLDGVIPVDYYVPGCPPTPNIVRAAFETLLGPDRPPKGAVLAPDHALCEQCPRRETRSETLAIHEFRRVQACVIQPDTCILEQGVLCLGPSTRAGCEARCIAANMPCTGCFGPTGRVRDFGAKALSAVASVIDAREDQDVASVVDGIADPAGTFFRYSLPSSFLERKCGK